MYATCGMKRRRRSLEISTLAFNFYCPKSVFSRSKCTWASHNRNKSSQMNDQSDDTLLCTAPMSPAIYTGMAWSISFTVPILCTNCVNMNFEWFLCAVGGSIESNKALTLACLIHCVSMSYVLESEEVVDWYSNTYLMHVTHTHTHAFYNREFLSENVENRRISAFD